MMVMVMMVILMMMMMMMRTQLQAYQNITVFSTAAFCMSDRENICRSAIFTHATTSAMMLMMLLLLSAWIGATVQQTGVLDSLSAKV